MFNVFQSCPFHSVAFLLTDLDTTTKSTRGDIFFIGIVISIALDLGLRNQVAHLVPLGGHTLLDIDHFLNQQLARVRRPNEFHLLINNKVVHYFVLPNPEQTNVHNRDNRLYQLEGQGEAPTPPQTPPKPEYHKTPLSDISSSSFSAGPPSPHGHNVDYELNALQREVTTLRQALQDQTDRMEEQLDHLYQEL